MLIIKNNYMRDKTTDFIDLCVNLRKAQLNNWAQTPMQRAFIKNEFRLIDNKANAIKGFNALFCENNYQKALFYWRLIK